ncbi:hypothetical protein [uncultured Parabacteroides sp.]|uniref:hypothetical protein n=1 Tax=uncultured Parabacteroides sp. TaxID=512312 RepID=UPI0025DFE68F|nr:hypothetical protein [uncultured Parabacteroides sp.]
MKQAKSNNCIVVDFPITTDPQRKGAANLQALKNYEVLYPELQELYFGEINGINVFDATKYLELKKVDPAQYNLDDFKDKNQDMINRYANKLGYDDPDYLFFIDEAGDVMIHAYLAFTFVSYVDPQFVIYMHDRMHDLLFDGFVVSDNYLACMAKRRLPKKVLNRLIEM